MNKLFFCNNSGQLHYVYAKDHTSATHKFKQRFKKLFGCWNFNANDIREVKKTFPMDPQAEIHKQIKEYSHGIN